MDKPGENENGVMVGLIPIFHGATVVVFSVGALSLSAKVRLLCVRFGRYMEARVAVPMKRKAAMAKRLLARRLSLRERGSSTAIILPTSTDKDEDLFLGLLPPKDASLAKREL